MKKVLSIILLLLAVCVIFGQESDTLPPFLYNFCHSAPVPSGITYFQADIDPDLPGIGIVESYLAYTSNNWTTRNEVPATSIGATSALTYGANITNPGSGTVQYYFHFQCEDRWAGQPPIYPGSLTTGIPDNFYFSGGWDGFGTDSTPPSHPNADDLDILEYWFGMSNSRFYGKIRNATGNWHLENGNLLFGGKHVFGYGIAINNPDRPEYDYMYIMAQSGELVISGISDIRPGVMRAYIAEGSEEVNYIGAAEFNTVGDILEMSAPISTFTSDPHFGGAVPSSGFYTVTAFTMYLFASLSSQDFTFVDQTKLGKLYVNNFSNPQSWQYVVGSANTAPVLSSPGHDGHEVWVTYTDAENHPAVIRQVSIGGGAPITMTTDGRNYSTGAVYRAVTGHIGAGTTIEFYFTDGQLSATLGHEVGIEEFVSTLPDNLELRCAPNPFNSSAQISFAIDKGQFVSVDVFDISGRKVANLISDELSAGVHTTRFDASSLNTGIYFVNLTTAEQVISKKIVYMR